MNRPPQPGRILRNVWILLLAAFSVLAVAGQHPGTIAQAQWTTNGNDVNNTNTGNVGVGTTAPVAKLDVTNSEDKAQIRFGMGASNSGGFLFSNGPGHAVFSGGTGWNGGWIARSMSASFMQLNGGAISFFGNTGLTAGNAFTPAELMRITASGSVGIGTITPGYRLDIQGGQINASGGLCIANDCKTSWSQVSGGSSQWTTSGTSVYYSGGNVGIGTSTPGARFDVGAGATARGSYTDLLIGTGGNNPQLEFYGATKSSAIAHDETLGGLVFYTNGPSFSPSFFVSSTGNVGVGTTSPTSKLEVNGFAKIEGTGAGVSVKNTNGWSQMVAVRTGTNQAAFIASPATISPTTPYWAMGLSSDNSAGWSLDTWDGATMTTRMRVMPSTGSVGIGTTAPGYKLDVQGGQINASGGLCIANDCKTSWSQVGGGTSSQWTTNGTNISYSGGNVGIGNSAPGSQLFVGSGTPSGAVLPGINVALGPTGGSYVAASNGTINTFMGSDTSSYGIVGTLSNHPLGLRVNNTLAVTVMPGGSVGIGTATPTQMLDVNGAGEVKARAAGTISAAIQLQESNGTTTWSEWQQYYDRLRLNMNNGSTTKADVMTILSNGKVGIGKDTPTEALDVVGNIKATGNISATYQDVAEWVPSTQRLAAGTVVVLDADKTNHVLASTKAYDTGVAGVVSAQPGIILGAGGDDKLQIATTGRVKVKVDATRAPIKVGDLLVTSGVEGVAMKSIPVDLGGAQMHRPGTIVGKALESLESGTGEILVLLSLQ